MNRERLPIFTDTPKMYLAHALYCSLFAKCFLADRFSLYSLPKFPLPKLSHVQCMELLYKGAYFIFHCVLNLNVNFVCLVGGKKTVFKD